MRDYSINVVEQNPVHVDFAKYIFKTWNPFTFIHRKKLPIFLIVCYRYVNSVTLQLRKYVICDIYAKQEVFAENVKIHYYPPNSHS